MSARNDTPPDVRRTPPERPSAKRPPVEFVTPTPKTRPSAPRPSAPVPSPQLNAAELVAKANKTERALRRPGWEVTNNGDLASNGYVKRKAKLYAALISAIVLGVGHLVDRTVPLLWELYEKHLDRQAERAKVAHP